MLRQNKVRRQQSFFSGEHLLPTKVQTRFHCRWAETLYYEPPCRLDKMLFAPFHGQDAPRPNCGANVPMGDRLLRIGIGRSGDELYNLVCFDPQTRHVLGLHNLGVKEVMRMTPTLRVVRRRVEAIPRVGNPFPRMPRPKP